jgi:hypothetical protein
MKKLNYSKGDWHLPHFVTNKDNPKGCQCLYILNDGYCGSIADVSVDNGKNISEGGNDSPPLEEAIANAKIICEAPNMYELIMSMLQDFKQVKHEYKVTGYNRTIDRAETLIKRLHK